MSHRIRPVGHVYGPVAILGVVALLLGFASEKMGVFHSVNEALRGVWRGQGLEIQSELGLPGPVGLGLTALMVFGLIYAILGTPGEGRRAILGFSVLLLTAFLFPAFAVWGVFWKPSGMILAVIWGWISATLYARNHLMPCEILLRVAADNVINLSGDPSRDSSTLHLDGQS